MQVYRISDDANRYSVPFDWDDDKSIDYVRSVVEEYFDSNRQVGKHWQPSFFGIVKKKMKLGEIGTLSGSEMLVFNQNAVEHLYRRQRQSLGLY